MENSTPLSPEQQDLVASILGEYNTDADSLYVEAELPSRGIAYRGNTVTIRPFTFEDEKYALGPAAKMQTSNFVNLLLSRCVKGIDVEDLLLMDRDYLLFKLKELSTGETITAGVTCQACGAENTIDIQTSMLENKRVPEEMTYPMTVTLPKLGKELQIKPFRVSDERNLSNLETLSRNMWKNIESIEGITDGMVIAQVLGKLPVEDVHFLLKNLRLSEYGLQTQFNYLCGCGAETPMEVPFTESFFGGN